MKLIKVWQVVSGVFTRTPKAIQNEFSIADSMFLLRVAYGYPLPRKVLFGN